MIGLLDEMGTPAEVESIFAALWVHLACGAVTFVGGGTLVLRGARGRR